MGNVLLKFFLPSLDEPVHAVLQVSFAIVFLAAVIVTSWRVARAARPESWERNLARFDAQDKTIDAPWTADGLAAVVATPEERWAEVLPTLLLVFGLLGTFIGLGLALTEAAQALGAGGDSVDSLNQIMGSLGSKFKTSTWGILAFLTLKIGFVLRPYEEARHDWAVKKTRAWAAVEEARLRQASKDERQELVDAITGMGQAIVAEYRAGARQVQEGRERSLGMLAQIGDVLSTSARQQEAIIARIGDVADRGAEQLRHLDEQRGYMADIAKDGAATRKAMEGFVHGVSSNIAEMASAAERMSAAADAAGAASADVGAVIGEFRGQMVSVLNDVKEGLRETIDAMSLTFGENMRTMSSDLSSATGAIREAITNLSGGVERTITSLHAASEDSIKRQAQAQVTFAASGKQLMDAIGKIETTFSELQVRITGGLASVASTGQQIRSFEAHFKESNERVTQLVAGIDQQVQAHALATLRQQQHMDASERAAKQVAALVEGIAGVLAAIKDEDNRAAKTRAFGALERIETGIAGMAEALVRERAAVETTSA
jgi:septal ring factor EnvC (AmiA/AmiB activator)